MSYKYQVGQTYKSRNTEEIDKLRQKYLDRGEFTYDPAKDNAYQDYANMMRQQGNLAMENSIGMATASTGGYGNSYAQSVGQQTYNDYARDISAAQNDFYNQALNQFNNEGNMILNDIGMLEDREAADRAAWEEDYLNAYNAAVAAGDNQKVADILGMSLDDYNDSIMASGTALGDEQLQGYINALMNDDTVNGAYYQDLISRGYDVGNILNSANAYALANNLGVSIGDTGLKSGAIYDEDVTNGVRGLSNFNEGQKFHVQMHKKEHNLANNLDVQIGASVDRQTNPALYNIAKSNGLFVYNGAIYYNDNGNMIYKVNPQKNKNDEYNTLLKLIEKNEGRAGYKNL